MTTPIISIVIPCHNDGRYLSEAVASARAQTYPNTEIIIVNDHSTEPGTCELLSEMKRSGLPVLSTPHGRRGPSAARNIGIAFANGEFILPLDADDRIDLDYTQNALNIMVHSPSVGICYCKARLFGLKRGPWRLPSYSWEAILAGNMIFSTAVFRKRDWREVGGYDESLVIGLEDYAFWLRLIALGREVVQIDEELFYYRVKSNSRTALLARQRREMEALEGVYRSCEPILRDNALLLFRQIHRLQQERGELSSLVTWKILRHVFLMEWKVRQAVKRMIGRA